MSYPKLRLIYFPVRARAEGAKLIMEYGNIPYEEVNCVNVFGMSFQDVKKAGKLPFGQLPVLEINGEGGPMIGMNYLNLSPSDAQPFCLPKD